VRFFKWLFGSVTDPIQGTMSSTRVCGFACVISGLVFAFMHPSESASIGVILGGGGLSFFTRTKSDAP
jgi:membrane protease YdiL (CAAX protease family)